MRFNFDWIPGKTSDEPLVDHPASRQVDKLSTGYCHIYLDQTDLSLLVVVVIDLIHLNANTNHILWPASSLVLVNGAQLHEPSTNYPLI